MVNEKIMDMKNCIEKNILHNHDWYDKCWQARWFKETFTNSMHLVHPNLRDHVYLKIAQMFVHLTEISNDIAFNSWLHRVFKHAIGKTFKSVVETDIKLRRLEAGVRQLETHLKDICQERAVDVPAPSAARPPWVMPPDFMPPGRARPSGSAMTYGVMSTSPPSGGDERSLLDLKKHLEIQHKMFEKTFMNMVDKRFEIIEKDLKDHFEKFENMQQNILNDKFEKSLETEKMIAETFIRIDEKFQNLEMNLHARLEKHLKIYLEEEICKQMNHEAFKQHVDVKFNSIKMSVDTLTRAAHNKIEQQVVDKDDENSFKEQGSLCTPQPSTFRFESGQDPADPEVSGRSFSVEEAFARTLSEKNLNENFAQPFTEEANENFDEDFSKEFLEKLMETTTFKEEVDKFFGEHQSFSKEETDDFEQTLNENLRETFKENEEMFSRDINKSASLSTSSTQSPMTSTTPSPRSMVNCSEYVDLS